MLPSLAARLVAFAARSQPRAVAEGWLLLPSTKLPESSPLLQRPGYSASYEAAGVRAARLTGCSRRHEVANRRRRPVGHRHDEVTSKAGAMLLSPSTKLPEKAVNLVAVAVDKVTGEVAGRC
jgi:hypothetical protein